MGGSDNYINTNPHKELDIDVRKVPADDVPYGESISRNGVFVWAAYDDERLVAVAATADEARRKYREYKRGRP